MSVTRGENTGQQTWLSEDRELAWEEIQSAFERVTPFIHRTAVCRSSSLDRMCGGEVFFKCENLQKTGSFKIRGATNGVCCLTEGERRRGVVTHSSGNYAQALALAAGLQGVACTVVIPENAPAIKVQASREYGANVVFCAPTYEAREATVAAIQKETGAVFLHSHDQLPIIAGQGTAAIELLEQVEGLDLIVTPVGGGSLISGTAIATRHFCPNIRVVGCEPQGANDAYRSLETGERIVDFVPQTIADGLLTPLGEHGFRIIQRHVDEIILVSEEEIIHAMRFVWERMKLIIEPSSAVAVSPLLTGALDVSGKRAGVILTGGNVDLSTFFDHLRGTAP